jgi:quercetin dioxygenase-like cupin family protein
MTSLDRPLSGDAMVFDLAQEIETARAAHSPAQTCRTGRTLLKDGPLRITLIIMQAGGEIPEHSAEGPIAIHVLTGSIRVDVAGQHHPLGTGQILAAQAGIRHAIAADQDAVILLTVVMPGQDG